VHLWQVHFLKSFFWCRSCIFCKLADKVAMISGLLSAWRYYSLPLRSVYLWAYAFWRTNWVDSSCYFFCLCSEYFQMHAWVFFQVSNARWSMRVRSRCSCLFDSPWLSTKGRGLASTLWPHEVEFFLFVSCRNCWKRVRGFWLEMPCDL